MAKLPADRTKLNAAVQNQQPSFIADAIANREALIEAYDTIDMLYNFTAGLVAGGTLQPYPHGLYRNAIINGNFDVCQRGGIFSNVPSGTYTADRWLYLYDGAGQQHTISRQAFTPGQTEVPNEPRYFLRVAVTNPASGQTHNAIHQRIESVRTFAGQKVTFSFWAKADASRTLAVNFWQSFGSGGSSEVGVLGGIFNLTTFWQRYTCTVDIPSIAGKTIGSGDFLAVDFSFPIGETFTIDIAQVQLNAGDVALPYQPRQYAEELALCMRYFEKSYDVDVTPGSSTGWGMETIFAVSSVESGGHLDLFRNGPLQFKVPKRTSSPTIQIFDRITGQLNSIYNDSTGQSITFSSVDFLTPGQNQVNIRLVGLNGSNIINAGDMLSYHWTADAEL